MDDLTRFRNHQLNRPDRSPSTVKDEVRRLRMIGRELEGMGLTLAEVSAEQVRDWLAIRRLGGWSEHQYNNRAKALNAWLAWRDGLEDETPFEILPTAQDEYRALSPAEFDAYRAILHPWRPGRAKLCGACGRHAVEHVDALHLVAGAFCVGVGLRPEEVARLDRQDYDQSTRTLTIRRPAKRGKKRRIPIARWVCDLLDYYLTHRPVPPPGPHQSALIVNEWRGLVRRVHANSLSHMAREDARRIGIRLNYQIGRHTVATRLLQAGLDIRYVQYYLGHVNIRNTARYAEVRFEDVEERYRKLLNEA